jgi:DNA-binding response OmpR family regulator
VKPILLLTEVDADLRDIYRLFLVERGFAVETASDGLECLAKLRRLDPDLLILDQDLLWGGADGVLAWMRESASDTPVVLTTTAPRAGLPEEGMGPVVKILAKPFSLKALVVCARGLRRCGTSGSKQPESRRVSADLWVT